MKETIYKLSNIDIDPVDNGWVAVFEFKEEAEHLEENKEKEGSIGRLFLSSVYVINSENSNKKVKTIKKVFYSLGELANFLVQNEKAGDLRKSFKVKEEEELKSAWDFNE